MMDYADKLDMMDDDCDVQGYYLDDDIGVPCAECPLSGGPCGWSVDGRPFVRCGA